MYGYWSTLCIVLCSVQLITNNVDATYVYLLVELAVFGSTLASI